MKDALIDIQAVPGSGPGRLARFVRHGVLACLMAAVGAGAMAQERGRRDDQGMRDRYQMQAQDQRIEQQRMLEQQRLYEMQMREERRYEMRQEPRGERRMTPDERSDLRRQINEARRDLYPNAQRR